MKNNKYIITLIILTTFLVVNYANAITFDNKAYWKLEEASGSRTDEVGSYNLTDNNTVTSGAGKIGNAASFDDANSEYLSSTTSLGLSMATYFTYNFWVNITALPTASEVDYTFHWADNVTANQKGDVQIQLYNDAGTQQIYLYRRDSAGGDQAGANYTLTQGTWFMLTYTWDGSNHKLFINGSATPTITGASTRTGTNTANTPNATFFKMAGSEVDARFMHGLLDEWGVWSRVLTSSEITELYNGGAGLTYSSATTPPSIESDLIIFE